jgi:hypothetical protein
MEVYGFSPLTSEEERLFRLAISRFSIFTLKQAFTG